MKIAISFFIILFSVITEARLSYEVDENTRVSQMRGVSIVTDDSTSCFPPKLLSFINELRTRFGRVEINSGYRSRSHNRQVGGARRSQHMSCNAIDFSVPGVPRSEVKLFLTANFRGRAGVGFYCNNRFHLDVGNVRQWGGCQPSSRDIALAQRRYPRTVLAQIQNQSDDNQRRDQEYAEAFATSVQ